MFTSRDLLKALINGCRAWRVMSAVGGHYHVKKLSVRLVGNAKISTVRSLADICFLHVLIRLFS